MPTAELALAILALLLTPGPTNTLMLLSGADRGLRASLPLVPVELAAYLCAVTPLVVLAQAAAPQMAALRPAIALVAGLWVLTLALRLWRKPAQTDGGRDASLVTPHRIFITTLLNPKALIIGLVLLPGSALLPGLASFAALVVAVAILWIALGMRLPRAQGAGLPDLVRRAAACWLAVLSMGILANGFTA